MAEKVYRPKSGNEGLALTVNLSGEMGGRRVEIDSWPFATNHQDAQLQAHLDEHPLVTDRPEPKSKKEDS